MKKSLSILMSLILATSFLAGCGSKATPTNDSNTNTKTSTGVKTGLAISTSVSSSTDAGDKDGLAQARSTIAAVTVDKDGKIVKCVIDEAVGKANFSKAGKITSDLKSTFKTAQQAKDEFGMKKASKIGKEWYEQGDAFAKYVVGKTAAEVKGIAVTTDGKASDKDLVSSCTMNVTAFIDVVSKAAENAQDLGAKSTDKLGLGVNVSISGSKDAGDKDGLAQIYSYYTATTFNDSGKVTSCIIDATQGNVNFSKTGKITSDIKSPVLTKNELGDKYGMKKSSKIGKEWYEQAAAFAKYAVGKTADELNKIAVTQQGVPSGTDLNTSVTIHIAPFQTVIASASQNAR